MPSWELFDHQEEEYRDRVLPPYSTGARIGGASGSTLGWHRYARSEHRHEHFRRVGAAQRIQKKFGFTPDAVVAAAKEEIIEAVGR